MLVKTASYRIPGVRIKMDVHRAIKPARKLAVELTAEDIARAEPVPYWPGDFVLLSRISEEEYKELQDAPEDLLGTFIKHGSVKRCADTSV